MRENEFARMMTRLLRERGALVYPLVADERTPPGWPDKLVVSRQWTGLIELKARKTRVEPHQIHVMRELNLRRAGYAVVVRETDTELVEISYHSKTKLFQLGVCKPEQLPFFLGDIRWEELC